DSKGWVDGKILRLVFQNLLVERNNDVLTLSKRVWSGLVTTLNAQGEEILAEELCPHMEPIFRLTTSAMSVPHQWIPMDATLFIKPSGQAYTLSDRGNSRKVSPPLGEPPKKRHRKSAQKDTTSSSLDTGHNIDGPILQGDIELVGFDVMMRCRIAAAEALGEAAASFPAARRKMLFLWEISAAL